MDEPPSVDAPNVERPSVAQTEENAATCGVCNLPIEPQEQVARLHEMTTHRDCYERADIIDRGR